MLQSDLSIVNQALVRIGANPVPTLESFEAQSVTAANLFQTISENVTSMHPWAHALRSAELSQLSVDEEDRRWHEYRYVFQLPNDRIRILGLESLSSFRIAGDRLFTDDEHARAVYIARTNPQSWPANFVHLVVLECAAAFAISVTDSANRAQMYMAEAREQRSRAMAEDSQQTPPWVFNLMRIYARERINPLATA